MDSQELGGNIVLTGFSSCDLGTMHILKKIVGNYARDFSENMQGFEKLHLKLNQKENCYDVEAILISGGNSTSSLSSQPNIFMSVDSAIKGILKNP